MAIKVKKQTGGSGVLFWVLLVIMFYAGASIIVAWQTYDDCGGEHDMSDWRVYPPGWVCDR